MLFRKERTVVLPYDGEKGEKRCIDVLNGGQGNG